MYLAMSQSPALSDNTWFSQLADQVLQTFPGLERYTCAAGISPSGIVHFGNFRDVITAYGVARELKERGKAVRMLFSWDEFDRFRKVPEGIDPGFSKYIGMPLTSVPDPLGEFPCYARRFESEFEGAMQEIGIELDYRYQTKNYTSGMYWQQIVVALRKRHEIADILLSFKTEKCNLAKGIEPEQFRETYYPITLYSRFTGTDKTEITGYDGETKLTYRCLQSNQSETIDFRETPIVKLPWKVDWAMRWGFEGVNFEPAGKDHSSPGGSFDVSTVINKEIFGTVPPVPYGYEFVGIQGLGGKMSGSKGNAVSPATLLEIYEPALLKWPSIPKSTANTMNSTGRLRVSRRGKPIQPLPR
jgi:lysyl-tRNA synthetase class 1